jgi:galactonate dehydratase
LLRGFTLFPGLATLARGAAAGKMKITKFVMHKSSLRWRDLLFLEIHTDQGLVGYGEGSLHTRVPIVEEALRWLEPRLVGLDPAGVEQHWDRIYYGLSRWRNGPVLITALSAVDIALWDLEGKRLGVPVWRLLGGPMQKELRAYYTHWNAAAPTRTPEEFGAWAAATKANGWTAVKWAIPRAENETVRIERASANLEAIRKAAGPYFDICLELYESFSARSTFQFAEAVAKYRPFFIEEPIQRENSFAHSELASHSPVPLATGEGLLSRHEYRQLLEAKGAKIIQPDVLHCGGITEIRKIAWQGETYGVEVAPHQCYGPIAHVASLSAMSVCRNFLIHEWEAQDDPLFQEVTGGAYPVQRNGKIALPEGPGLGVTVNGAEFARRFPFRSSSSA